MKQPILPDLRPSIADQLRALAARGNPKSAASAALKNAASRMEPRKRPPPGYVQSGCKNTDGEG